MRTSVPLPDLGQPSDVAAEVTVWLVDRGESVQAGQSLLEVLIPGATVVVPAPCAGVLVEQLVRPRQQVRTGTAVATLEVAAVPPSGVP
jgi:pyruvate/2-oxoglutarate dehydrogenase complex dihydrolipoamide acyltransferase (E2) component